MEAITKASTGSETGMAPIAGPAKVAAEPAKLAAYLESGQVFPTSLELDLGTACNR